MDGHVNTATTPDRHPAAETAAPGRATAAAVSLVGGAVALALGRALTSEGGTPVERLQQVAGHEVRITASVVLAMVGFAALIPGFLAVTARVRQRGALLATIGAGLTVMGCAGFVALVAIGDLPVIAAARAGSPDEMAEFLHQLDDLPLLAVLGPLAAVGYFIGPFLVTLAARRAGRVPAWLPWGVLAALILQPIGLVLAQGPGTALQLIDTVCQLALVVAVVALARSVLTGPEPAGQDTPGAAARTA